MKYVIFLSLILQAVWVRPVYPQALSLQVPLYQEAVMLGGADRLPDESPSLRFSAEGECWFSTPLTIPETGAYRFRWLQEGAGVWDLLIDGEVYPSLTGLILKDGENILPLSVLLDEGQHSLIFRSRGAKPGTYRWSSLRAERPDPAPERFVNARRQWEVLNGHSRKLEIGAMFGGSYINVNIARDRAMFSRNGYQYISYYHPEGYLVVGRRRHDAAYFEKYWVPISGLKAPPAPAPGPPGFSLSDPHYFISMQMDGQGFIHLAFGNQTSALKYLRSAAPYRVDQWVLPEGPLASAEEEKRVTYVQFTALQDGDLLATFRVGTVGDGYSRLVRYDTAQRRWSALYSPFIADEGRSNPYHWRSVVSPDGTVHMAWTWRLSVLDPEEIEAMAKNGFGGFSNRNICYAKSSDGGRTWLRSDGTVYELPIDRSAGGPRRAEVLVEILPGEDFFNHYGADHDAEGRPHFTYTRWGDPQTRVAQQWHLFWDGREWKNRQVTRYTHPVRWTQAQQHGLAGTEVTRPSIVVGADGTAIVISRGAQSGHRIELYLTKAPYDGPWKEVFAYPGSVGGWEPQMDLDLWHETGKLDLLLLAVTDRAVHEDHKRRKPQKMPLRRKVRNFLLGDPDAKIWKTDAALKEDTGYLLEIDPRSIP